MFDVGLGGAAIVGPSREDCQPRALWHESGLEKALEKGRDPPVPNSHNLRAFTTEIRSMTEDELLALKIAFTYMPQAIEVTQYEYGDRYEKVLEQVETVRATLLDNGIDPDEVAGEINPESSPNSYY